MGLRHVRSIFILLIALIFSLILINNVNSADSGCCAMYENDLFVCYDMLPNECVSPNVLINETDYCGAMSVCEEGCCCLTGNPVGQYMAEYFCSGQGQFHLGSSCDITDCSVAPATYNVTGSVHDVSNNLVPGATVNISYDTFSKQVTTGDGFFSFLNINPGSCNIIVYNDSCSQKAQSCYISNSNINVDIVLDDCCQYSCGSLTACDGENQTQTCVATSGNCAEQEYTLYFPCSLTGPCTWDCTDWSLCEGNIHTRTCTENPPGWSDCVGAPDMPPESEDCDVGSFVTCGDGFPQPGEECDFNTTGSGDHFSTCTLPYNDDLHCTNDCRCYYSAITLDSCTDQHVPQEIAKVDDVNDVLALDITWNLESQTCLGYINHSMIWYCHASSDNQCDSYGWRLINDSIPGQGPKEYIHYSSTSAALIPKENYCYKITTVYNNSVNNPRVVNSSSNNDITCQRLGDPECFIHIGIDDSWCGIVGGVSTAFNCTPNTNELQSDQCTYGVCQIINGEANCTSAAPSGLCDSCNNVLGLFGYQGFSVTPISYTDPNGFQCPSLTNPVSTYGEDNVPACYLDFTTSAVDKAYDCMDVASCYDYKSRGACQNDYCNKFFNGTDVDSNMCEWAWYDGEFNKGICRPKEAFVASGRIDLHCDYCYSTDYNHIYPSCTGDVCGLFGSTCFYNALNQCINSNGITCGNYSTEGECIGADPSRNVNVNTGWSGNPLQKSDGTNTRIPSNDYFNIGVCKWNSTTNKCFRDANNYTLATDCKTNPVNLTICERDIQSPSTTISISPGSRFGSNMNLRGGVLNIYDNGPWTIGDDFSDTNHNQNAIRQTIWMYYCINSSTIPACYPDKVLTTVSYSEDKRYTIDLTQYGDINNAYSTARRMYYFSEDPAKNLEVVKHFDFIIDLVAPNISLVFNMNTYPNGTVDPQTGPIYWTDLSFNISLRNESSLPVSCFFNLSTESPTNNPDWTNYVLQQNIPSSIPPNDNELAYVGDTLNTTYYRLDAGVYDYTLTCYDAVGNNYTMPGASLSIDGDGNINFPYPSNTSITYRRNDVPKNMSINTTADGSCRYADQIVPYNDMIPYNWTYGSGPYIHIASNPKLSSAYGTGIYRFYTACNISLNGQYMILHGSPADVIYFAIDESPPKTNMTVYASASGSGQSTFNPYIYDSNVRWDYMKITLDNIDSDPRLNSSPNDKDFGPNETFYCIKSITNNCTDRLLFNKYNFSNYDSAIELNYKDNGSLKLLYGNRPTLCYYSTDKGNNTENITCSRLNLRNLTFDAPDIEVSNNETAYPEINVSYKENVTVTSVRLVDNLNGISWQLYPNAPLFGQNFSFTTNYLPSENFTFTIIANDSDDNYQTNSTEFEITNPGLPIWLVDPVTGIGDHTPYEYTVGTPLTAHCKYQTGINPPIECRNSPADEWIFCAYANATGKFDITGNNYEHTINNLYASVVHSPITIFCKINDSAFNDSNPASYGYNVFHFGYDTSPPAIITPIEVSDNPLSDKDNHYVNITITTDEPAVCHISGGRNDPYAQSIDAFFDDKNLYAYSDYNITQTYTVAYDSSYPLNQNFLFDYNIVCYNYAQLTDSEDLPINVKYTNDMIITKKFPNNNYINQLSTPFEVRTNNAAWNGCEYQLNTDPTNHDMTANPVGNPNYKNFSADISGLIDGTNTVMVFCHGALDGSATFNLDVDTILPNISISGHNSTCGLDGFEFVINSSDKDSSGVYYVSYKIDLDGYDYFDWISLYNLEYTNAYDVPIQHNDQLLNNSIYTVYANATDLAGNTATANPLIVTALEPNAVSCDYEPPVIEVTNVTEEYRATYTVACSDVGSGCSDTYSYVLLKQGNCSTVTPEQFSETKFYNESILIRDVGYLCIRVYDLNQNYDTSENFIALNLPNCNNGVREVVFNYYLPGENPNPDNGNDYYEQCDGSDLGGFSCDSFGWPPWSNGTIRCNADCTLDTDNCNINREGWCGNNKIDYYYNAGPNNVEQCDGPDNVTGDWGHVASCQDFGFNNGGTVSCNPNTASRQDMCKFNTSQCRNTVITLKDCTSGPLSTLDIGEQCEMKTTNPSDLKLQCSDFDNFTGGQINCFSPGSPFECMYDLSGCIPPEIPSYCGDGVPEGLEECDYNSSVPDSIYIRNCTDPEINTPLITRQYINGTASCNADCTWNRDNCVVEPECHDGVWEFPEVCDTDAFGNYVGNATCTDFNFAGGIIGCNADCSDWDTGNCAETVNIGYCGDNMTNNAPDEQCDGTSADGDWGKITSCQDFNFTGGQLSCNDYRASPEERCMFNTSLCTPRVINNAPSCKGPSGSGTITLDKGEQCEDELPLTLECIDFDNFTGGPIQCSQDNRCVYDLSQCTYPEPAPECGDDTINGDEQCDGQPKYCYDFSGYTGDILLECGAPRTANACQYDLTACTPIPWCGDNMVNTGRQGGEWEECDGSIGNITCELLGHAGGGNLYCYDNLAGPELECTFNETRCDWGYGYCGDGIINNQNTEQCEGDNPLTRQWGNITDCKDFGFEAGPVSCNNCQFDTSLCIGVQSGAGSCGNNLMNPKEQCEPDMFIYNRTNLTCESFDSFTNGTLFCNPEGSPEACQIDLTGCQRITKDVCGDGNITGEEQCEGTNMGQNPPTCKDFYSNSIGGSVTCYPKYHDDECKFNTEGCVIPPNPEDLCGNGVLDIIPNFYGPGNDYYELCDGADLGGYSCTSFAGFEGGILGCTNTCQAFDDSNCAITLETGYCGDNKTNNFLFGKEQCDGTVQGHRDWGDITSCADFGFQGGNLSCNSFNFSVNDRCKFNTSQCMLENATNKVCGAGTLSIGEQCEPTLNNPLKCDQFDSFGRGIISCDSDCRYNIDGCEPPVYQPTCNDGKVEDPEQCDVPGTIIMSCKEYDQGAGVYNYGDVVCSNDCRYDDSGCSYQELCGNGQIDRFADYYGLGSGYYEDCDGINFGGWNCTDFIINGMNYAGGILSCTPPNPDGSGCRFDISNCAISLEVGFCGDHEINNFENGKEQCDGNTWGSISGCQDFGFTNGTLKCYGPDAPAADRCKFDTSGCTLDKTNILGCGSGSLGTLTIGEQCDINAPRTLNCTNFDSFGGGVLSCGYDCRYDISQCQPPTPPAVCGDGNWEQDKEICDSKGAVLGSCYDFTSGFYDLGDVICIDCQANTSQCRQGPSCENDAIEHILDYYGPGQDYIEQCEFAAPAGMNCSMIGNFDGGILSCYPKGHPNECMLNTENCAKGNGYCGDNITNNYFKEDCDGTQEFGDWGTIDKCSDLGFLPGGLLSCNSSCQFDTSLCVGPPVPQQCGDGVLSPKEDCDYNKPNTFNNLFCTDFDQYRPGGAVGCTNNCEFEFSGCYPPGPGEAYCGDNNVDIILDEQCDGSNLGNFNNCSDLGFDSGTLSCNPSTAPEGIRCTLNTDGCIKNPEPVCGDDVAQNIRDYYGPGQDYTEECDNTDLLGMHCDNFNGWSDGTLKCFPKDSTEGTPCTLDTRNCEKGAGFCGNNNIDHYVIGGVGNWEQCDGLTNETGDWGPITSCKDFGFNNGGTLSCNNNSFSRQDMCKFNTSQCRNTISNTLPRCTGGDTAILQPNEQCENNGYLNNLTCANFNNFSTSLGYVLCNNCMYDLRNCEPPEPLPVCNNNNWETDKGEQCDIPGVFESCTDANPELYESGFVTCTSKCELDFSQCKLIVTRGCGNGILDPGEDCEGSYLRGLSCDNFGWDINWSMGTLGCYPSDYPNPELRCTFDTSNCDKGGGFCGDNNIDHYVIDGINNWEQCDGVNNETGDWGPITSCKDFGYAEDGILSCNPNTASRQDMCKFNTSQCINSDSTFSACTPTSAMAILDPGEQCEGPPRLSALDCSNFNSFEIGDASCNNCMYDISNCIVRGYCGDGVINNFFNEQCDTQDFGDISGCNEYNNNYTGGQLSCSACHVNTSQCISPDPVGYCGDANINPGEDCEENGTITLTCSDFVEGSTGNIGCYYDTCTYDLSDCRPLYINNTKCGNGQLDTDYGEECDPPGEYLNCADFAPGVYDNINVVTCTNTCMIDHLACTIPPFVGCGNGKIEPQLDEECDGTNFGGQSCTSFGLDNNWLGGTLRCIPSGEPNACHFDTGNCDKGGGYCGDNNIDHYVIDNIPNWEQCDGNNPSTRDWGYITNCSDFGYEGGILTCNPNTASRQDMCKFNTSQCINSNSTYRGCTAGDTATIDAGEQCEAIPRLSKLNCSSFDSFGDDLGYITCNSCRYDITNCEPPIPPAVCNDDKWEPDKGEACDPPGYLMTCEEYNPELYDAGNTVCTNTCEIDKDNCHIRIPDPICGNFELESGETCELNQDLLTCADFNYTGGGETYCNPYTCTYELGECRDTISVCDDGFVDPGEQCEEGKLGDITNCVQLNPELYIGGVPGCLPPNSDTPCRYDESTCNLKPLSRCGNNIREGDEQCDGNDTNNVQCTSLGNYVDGILGCHPAGSAFPCTWDTSNCDEGPGYCGDGKVNNYFNEACDGASPLTGDWGKIRNCSDLGFDSGTLRCIGCQFDTNLCAIDTMVGTCGNGDLTLNPGENCDPGRPLVNNCTDFDHYINGTLGCTNDCKFDFRQCELIKTNGECGDNVINNFPNEECDGVNNVTGDWGGIADCTDYGFNGGALSCNGCQFNISRCYFTVPQCGNGKLESGELCDGGNLNGAKCSDFGFDTPWKNGILRCDENCTYDISNCDKGDGYCGDNLIGHYPVNGIPNQEQCDGNDLTTKDWGQVTSCQSLGFTQGPEGLLSCNGPDASRADMCKFNTSPCTNPISTFKECTGGDTAILDPGEQCEATPLLTKLTCSDFNTFSQDLGSVSCNSCMYDLSECQTPTPPPICNDKNFEPLKGEECDTPGIIGSCIEFNPEVYGSGNVSCTAGCSIDVSKCGPIIHPPECGNGILDVNESCEYDVLPYELGCTDYDNFTGGTLVCNPYTCEYDISGCAIPGLVCGDGFVDSPEQCDRENIGDITSCADLDNETYSGGLPVCYPPGTANHCMLDMSTCIKRAPGQVCGDHVVNGSEQCDGSIGTMSCAWIDNYIDGTLSCNLPGSTYECMWDTSKCDKGLGYCGDKIINNYFNEECDGTSPSTGDWGRVSSCKNLGFENGTLACTNNCQFDTSKCTTPAGLGRCGDGILNNGEDCDYNATVKPSCNVFDHYAGGTLGCNTDCTFDTSGCELPPVNGYCGDGLINDFSNEQCDGANWGKIAGCQDFGLAGGTLSCYNNQSGDRSCTFNTNACTGTVGTCGDSRVNPGEKCEPDVDFNVICKNFDNFTGGILHCNPNTCDFDVSGCNAPGVVCGDGFIDGLEQCDVDNLGRITSCTQLDSNRYLGGVPRCYPPGTGTACMLDTSSCIAADGVSECGDGYVEKPEECDGSIGAMNCSRIDGYVGGILTCNAAGGPDACQLNSSDCDAGYGYCGDKLVNNFPYEECDGANWGAVKSCKDLGFENGTLACIGCQFNTDSCTSPVVNKVCGDGMLASGEDCEPTINLTIGCTKIGGFIGGNLTCGADCGFNINGCISPTKAKCGDGIVSGSERCDGTNLNGITTCEEYDDRYSSGDLKCNSDCRYNITQCGRPSSSCGNNITDSGEECDGDVDLLDCTDYDLANGELTCTSSCKINTSGCEDPYHETAICGNGLVEAGEKCDSGLRGIEEDNFISLLGCNYGIECSSCIIECKLAPMQDYLCSNLLTDEGETDIDCGGTCPPCGAGLKCTFDSDCNSGICQDNVCINDPCTNGLTDVGESDTDCGGNCEPCGTGMLCTLDNDCASGKCVDGACVGGAEDYVPGPSTPGIIMLVVGILSTLGGAGYIIYKTYYVKTPKSGMGLMHPLGGSVQRPVTQQPVDPRLLALQQQKLAQKKELQDVQRRSLLKGFDGDSAGTAVKSPDGIEKWKEKAVGPGASGIKRDGEFVELSDLKPDKPASSGDDVFAKLSEISGSKSVKKETSNETATKTVHKTDENSQQTTTSNTDNKITNNKITNNKITNNRITDDKDISEASVGDKTSNKGKTKKESKALNKRKSLVKPKSGAFTSLDTISAEDKTVKQKIIEFSGKSENKVNNLLKSSTISHEQASKVFDNMNRTKLTSDPFKDILSSLITSGKLSKQTVYNLLFEYMDQGVLSKKDVAKILSDLKAV